MLRRLVSILALAGVCAVTACSESDDDPAQSQSGRAGDGTALRELRPFERMLARDYSLEAVPQNRLPRREPIVPPRERSEIPDRIEAVEGLRVNLPGGGTGLVYRYESKELASAAATGFLGKHDPSDGVQGCGKNLFYSQSTGRAAEVWRRRVSGFLARHEPSCDSMFMVME